MFQFSYMDYNLVELSLYEQTWHFFDEFLANLCNWQFWQIHSTCFSSYPLLILQQFVLSFTIIDAVRFVLKTVILFKFSIMGSLKSTIRFCFPLYQNCFLCIYMKDGQSLYSTYRILLISFAFSTNSMCAFSNKHLVHLVLGISKIILNKCWHFKHL